MQKEKQHRQPKSVSVEHIPCEKCGLAYLYNGKPLHAFKQPDGSKKYLCKGCL